MSQRYQKEIEEILDQVNESVPPGKKQGSTGSGDQPAPPKRFRGGGSPFLSWLPVSISPGRLLITGIVLLLAALVLRSAVPGVAGPLTWAGVGLFIAAYVTFFLRPRRPVERRWRDRSIEDEDVSTSWNPWERFWRWLNRS